MIAQRRWSPTVSATSAAYVVGAALLEVRGRGRHVDLGGERREVVGDLGGDRLDAQVAQVPGQLVALGTVHVVRVAQRGVERGVATPGTSGRRARRRGRRPRAHRPASSAARRARSRPLRQVGEVGGHTGAHAGEQPGEAVRCAACDRPRREPALEPGAPRAADRPAPRRVAARRAATGHPVAGRRARPRRAPRGGSRAGGAAGASRDSQRRGSRGAAARPSASALTQGRAGLVEQAAGRLSDRRVRGCPGGGAGDGRPGRRAGRGRSRSGRARAAEHDPAARGATGGRAPGDPIRQACPTAFARSRAPRRPYPAWHPRWPGRLAAAIVGDDNSTQEVEAT